MNTHKCNLFYFIYLYLSSIQAALQLVSIAFKSQVPTDAQRPATQRAHLRSPAAQRTCRCGQLQLITSAATTCARGRPCAAPSHVTGGAEDAPGDYQTAEGTAGGGTQAVEKRWQRGGVARLPLRRQEEELQQKD